jgi:hypothetical protein
MAALLPLPNYLEEEDAYAIREYERLVLMPIVERGDIGKDRSSPEIEGSE